MTKGELLKIIDVNTVTDENCKRLIVRIKDTLKAFEDKTEIGELASINEFVKNGGYHRSLIDGTKNCDIFHDLDTILKEIQTWVNKYIYKNEQVLYDNLDTRSHKGLIAFLTVIIMVAVAAICCTIAHLILGNEHFPDGESIAEVIGTCDFVLGVIGFVWERSDDLNKNKIKRKISSAKERAIETGDRDDYNHTIKIIHEEIKNSAIIKGKFNWFNKQIVNNH